MTKEELRIGNWIIDYESKIGRVNSIEEGEVLKVVNNEGCLISYSEIELYKPIPLTEEILLKCGFDDRYKKGRITLFKMFTPDSKFRVKVEDVMLDAIVEYLHQLQNLYFALTGEELNIEL